MSNFQQSQAPALRQAIQSLQTADSGIQKIVQDAENSCNNLAASYGGTDGGAFNGLISDWVNQVNDNVRGSLEQIIAHMDQTLGAQQRQQQSTTERINQSRRQAEVYNVLQG